MRRHENSDASVDRLIYQLPKLSPCCRVYATRRLIEEDNFRFMEDADGERQFLLPTERKACDNVVAMTCQVEMPQKLFSLPFYIFAAHPIYTTEQTYVLTDCKIIIERELLAHVADMLLYLLKFCTDVAASHSPTAFGWLVKTCENVHCCGLAGSVCTKEAEYFPTVNGERDVVNSAKRAERLDKVAYFDDVILLVGDIPPPFSVTSSACCGIGGQKMSRN